MSCRLLAAILSALSVLMLASCSGPAAPSQTLITNVLWKLHSLHRSNVPRIEVHNPEQFTIRFGDEGRVTIRADCNSCGGNYEITGQRLRLGILACTRAYCGIESLDTEYLGALPSATAFSTADGILTIEGPGVVLTFRQ